MPRFRILVKDLYFCIVKSRKVTAEDILKLRDAAEQTNVQFKERITRDNKNDVSSEMVALSNDGGGLIIVGIEDKTGRIKPLSYVEAQETTSLLGNLASESVIPSILINIENVLMDDGVIVVANIKSGNNKPYRDNKGTIWVKQGVDKRKVFDNTELVSILMEGGKIHPDSQPIKGTNLDNLDERILKEYVLKRFRSEFEKQELSSTDLLQRSLIEIVSLLGQTPLGLLKNLGLIHDDGTLTLAALVLMGKYPQKWVPAFTARCISFVGNDIGGTEFRDKSGGDADGNAIHLHDYIMSFLTRNLRHVQVEKEFNSRGELEVSGITLSEIVVNAILHRSYVIEAPLRIFIFDNRIEIHSPGLLPEGVNIENIKQGISVPRNKLLFNHGIYLLPYTGAGSGILRAMKFTPKIQFSNNESLNEFVTTIYRKDFPNEGVSVRDGVRDDVRDNDRVESIPYSKLDKTQKDIIQFCTLPRTAREIHEHIGYKYHPTYIKKFIKPLVEMGFIEMTIPDKPNSKYQKYRKIIRSQ